MEYSQLAILMLILAIGVLVAEIFIPSGGILAVIMLTCLSISIFCAWKAWWYESPRIWWTYVVVMVAVIPGTVAAALYALPRTAIGRQVLLDAPELSEVTPFAAEERRLQKMIGRYGKTLTSLNPGGLALVDGQRMHCFSEGVVIDVDRDVQVLAVRGTRLLVRPAVPPAAAEDVFLSDLDESPDPPLDFEVPQG